MDELVAFLKRTWAIFVAIVSLPAGLYGIYQSWQGNLNTFVFLSLFLFVGALWLICFYFAWLWKPEREDRSPPGFVHHEGELIQAQGVREQRRRRIRFAAKFSFVGIPILALLGFLSWKHFQGVPAQNTIVLVANFDGPEAQKYSVTRTIYSNLVPLASKYPDLEVERLDKTIEDREEARAEGKKKKASIVIWGWYGKTEEVALINANFEFLQKPKHFPELKQEGKPVQTLPDSELEEATIQTRLSEEVNYISLFTIGVARYAAADWDGAITRFTEALNNVEEPVRALDQSIAYFYRGDSYIYQGSYDLAIEDYNQAFMRDPNFVEALNNLGVAYRNQGKSAQALAVYEKAMQLVPEDADILTNQGNVFLDEGNYNLAIQKYNKAIELNPNLSEAHNNRGNAYEEIGQVELAILDYLQAIEINSEDTDVRSRYKNADNYNNLGNAVATIDSERAIKAYLLAIKLNPEHAKAYYNLGNIYLEQDRYNEAIEAYNQAIKINPGFLEVHINRGLAYLGKRDLVRAMGEYNQAIQLNPSFALALYNRGLIYYSTGDRDNAIQDFNRAFSLSKDLALQQKVEQKLQELGAQ